MRIDVSFYRKFAGTTALMLIGRGISVILGVIYARYLGPEQFGLYSYVLSIIAIATLPAIAGLPNLIIREVAKLSLSKEHGSLKGILNWSKAYVVGLSLIIMIGLYIALELSVFESAVYNLLFYALVLIPLRGLLTHQEAVFNGFRMPFLALMPNKMFTSTFTLIFVFSYLLFELELSAVELIKIVISATSLALILSYVVSKNVLKLGGYQVRARYFIKKWHLSLIPFTMMSVIVTCNAEFASLILGAIMDKESVAYFKVAAQGVALISLGLSAVNSVIMPNIARLYKANNITETQALITNSVRISCLISIPIIFVLVCFGESLINLLFGSEYIDAYPVLVILCLGQLFNVVMGSVGVVLNMTDNENRSLRSLFISLILNVALLFLLTPYYGEVGAAIAVSTSLIFWNMSMAFDVYRITGLKTWIK